MKVEEMNRQETSEGKLGVDNSIYVGDLPMTVTEADLYQMFSALGGIYHINVRREPVGTGKGKCYAYITFFDPSTVKQAIDNFNFYEINGSQIRVMRLNKELVKGRKEGNVVIKNLPKETDNQALCDTFSVFGDILSCKVQKNASGECTGVGFIQFEDSAVAQVAIDIINQTVIKDKKLVAVQCIPNEQRVNKKEEINKIFTNVYIKHFPADVTDEELKGELEKVGELTSFYMARKPDGQSKGVAFANYVSHSSAVAAIEALHDKPFPGRAASESEPLFYIQRAQLKNEREEELATKFCSAAGDFEQRRNIYITNLPGVVAEAEVLEYFKRFGSITTHKIGTDEKNNRSYAYICYEKREQASSAVEGGNGAEFQGQALSVTFFKTKKVREYEKASQMYNSYTGGGYSAPRGKKKAVPQDGGDMGYAIYTLILSLAPNYPEKIAQAGFKTDEAFARKITGMILELDEAEVKKAVSLGNVLSQYVEASLDELLTCEDEAKEEKVPADE
ncbi:polyadenylate-binding protein [Nematocida displodere]|uniref:Polyadenylate-binding protein n=1 Tax=Nematocida displodere TaxID=1805483 RepID=A0A177EBD9_9MICR|nr:polyadenylate-binding protein [Nematocida displodere]